MRFASRQNYCHRSIFEQIFKSRFTLALEKRGAEKRLKPIFVKALSRVKSCGAKR